MNRNLGVIKPVFFALLLTAGVARADAPPEQAVKDATEKIQAQIKAHHQDFTRDHKAFYAAVDQVVAPAFDVPYIAQITLGRTWRSANADQRTRFQAAFKNTLIHAYSDTLLQYSDSSHVDWLRASTEGTEATVRASVVRRSEPPVALAFGLHRMPAGNWLAYDILVEGISLITNFRSQFAAEVKRDGLDALIQRLEAGAGPG